MAGSRGKGFTEEKGPVPDRLRPDHGLGSHYSEKPKGSEGGKVERGEGGPMAPDPKLKPDYSVKPKGQPGGKVERGS